MSVEEFTFADYFLVCGLDASIGLQLERYEDTVQEIASRPPLERSYVAKVLSHFPQKRSHRQFPEEILAVSSIPDLCMPQGLRFCTQKDVPDKPLFHTIANIRADGSRIDGAVLTFYERVDDEQICDAMQILHTQHVKELTGAAEGEERLSLLENGYHPPGTISGGSHTLPRRGHHHKGGAVLSTVGGGGGAGHHGGGGMKGGGGGGGKRTSYYDSGQDALYVSKAVAIVTRLPMVTASKAILQAIQSLACSSDNPPPLPMESYVYWILHQVPLPPPGGTLKVTLNGFDIVCQCPSSCELPFFDFSLRSLFDLVQLDTVIKVYSCLLLEHQILLCSKRLQRLMLVAESLNGLALPFNWQHVYVPILPYSQASFLEAPLPFLMGLCYEDSIPKEVVESTMCILDIDTGWLQMPEDVPLFPDKQELIQELYMVFERFSDQHSLLMHGGRGQPDGADGSATMVGGGPGGCVESSGGGQLGDFARFRRNKVARDVMKRMSRSFDEDAHDNNNGILGGMHHHNHNYPPHHPMGSSKRGELTPLPLSVLQESESLARAQEIARKAGVEITLDTLSRELETTDSYKNSPFCQRYFQEMKFNNAVREIFLNRFTTLLYSYESFVIGGSGVGGVDRDSFLSNRDSTANFDKASFLSDQPESHLPFLAAFIETQMFTTFVDWKILSQWEEPDPNLALFDGRLQDLRDKFGQAMVRTPTYESCPSLTITEEMIRKREEALDYVVPQPNPLPELLRAAGVSPAVVLEPVIFNPGQFPSLRDDLLAAQPSVTTSPWKRRRPGLRQKDNSQEEDDSSGNNDNNKKPVEWLKHLVGTASGAQYPPSSSTQAMSDLKPAEFAKTNWKFVDQLLRETKGKTKRLLVEKMGAEAVPLGHTDLSITGVEENTLVASLCDLLERIWAHGLVKKQGKSGVWAHLLAHQDAEKGLDPNGIHIHANAHLTPANRGSAKTGSRQDLRASSLAPESSTATTTNNNYRPSTLGRFYLGGGSPTSTEREDNVNNNGSHPVVAYLQGLQRDIKESDTGGTWANSLVRAASFISSKIGPSSPQGDFAPAWSSTNTPATTPVNDYQSSNNGGHHNNPYGGGGQSYQQGMVPESPRKRSHSRPRSPDLRHAFRPLPTHIAYDLKNVLRMTEIKTEIGYARAFVRLSLERKLLHKHIKTLLSRSELLRKMYKRYAFLRSEDEREQFLYHILSLNAADFRCFTNTFTRTKMQYQVMLVPGGGRFTLSNTTANLWVRVAGTLAETPLIQLPKNTLQFTFEHKNLGTLSTLRIGHQIETTGSGGGTMGGNNNDNNTSAMMPTPPPKWFLEYVIARNEVTGHTFKFPCGRWLGRGVDDGALERLLVAETVRSVEVEVDDEAKPAPRARSKTPARSRSPSLRRSTDNPKKRITEIQRELGEAVNNIVKHFYRLPSEKEQRNRLTRLLCGENGLVMWMEKAFMVGFKSSRFFKQLYPWDYIDRVSKWFIDLMHTGGDQLHPDQRKLLKHMIEVVRKVGSNSDIGKEEKFQTFIIITVRDHVLSGLLSLMAWTPVTGNLYDEPSFLRTPKYLTFLTQLLHSLNEFTFNLEHSLTWAVN